MPEPEFIVAEISKNWSGVLLPTGSPLLCQQFEEVINVNFARGYELQRFALSQVMTAEDALNETIIAVFRRVALTKEGGTS